MKTVKVTNVEKFIFPLFQMLTFLMSVCHVLVVVSDWSVDPMAPSILKTAGKLGTRTRILFQEHYILMLTG